MTREEILRTVRTRGPMTAQEIEREVPGSAEEVRSLRKEGRLVPVAGRLGAVEVKGVLR